MAKTKERQVGYPVCQDIPHQVCVDVPKEVCHEIPEKKCAQKPYEVCHDKPIETCVKVHKKVPVKASKKIPKQKCVHTDGYQETGKLVKMNNKNIQLACNFLHFRSPQFPMTQHWSQDL